MKFIIFGKMYLFFRTFEGDEVTESKLTKFILMQKMHGMEHRKFDNVCAVSMDF
jgi:hypothetical protein